MTTNDWQREPGNVGPFARAAFAYRQLGWLGTLPLPARAKKHPPKGFTGWTGDYPSGADVMSWLEDGQGVGNIALRMPGNVLGLDVDDYVKGEGASAVTKTGLAAVHDLEQAWGPLPATWRSTSRPDGRSGIRFYRVPEGLRWPSHAAPSIETVHLGHRYAVVSPSIHPDTGLEYEWVSPAGESGVAPPCVNELPELPAAWVAGLTAGEAVTTYASSGARTEEYLEALRDGMGEPCPYVQAELVELARPLGPGQSDGVSRHDVMNQHVMALVRAGQVGHGGVERVLRAAFALWFETMKGERGEQTARSEWARAVDGAVDKVGLREPGSRCLCRSEADQAAQEAWLDGLATNQAAQQAQTVSEAVSGAPGVFQSTGDGYLDDLISREAYRREARRRVDALETEAALISRLAELDTQYLTRAQLASLRRPDPLIEGVLAHTSTILLRGRDATFKSFVALDWALSVATGRRWMMRDVEQGRVLYVMGEGAPGIFDRVLAWEDVHGCSVPDDAFVVRVSPVNLYRGGAPYVDLLRRVERGGFSLIVLDTLRKMSGGADGNGTDMGVVVDRIDELRRATPDGNGAVLTIAHTAKDDVDTRGWSGIEDDHDIVWHAIRKDESSRQLALRNTKQKNAAETPEIQLVAQPSRGSLVLTTPGAAGLVVSEPGSSKARRLWDVLIAHGQTGITQPALRDDHGFARATVSELLNRWIKEGRLDKRGYFYHADATQTPTFDDGVTASWGSSDQEPDWS